MRVKDAALERFEPRIMRNIRKAEVTRRDNHMIEMFTGLAVVFAITRGNLESAVDCPDITNHCIEFNVFSDIGLFHPAFDVVKQDGTRRIACDGLSKMLFKGIVGKFQPLFRTIGPEVAIHRPMARVAMLVYAGSPCVIPQAAPIRLFFKTNDVRDVCTFRRRRLKGAKLCKA